MYFSDEIYLVKSTQSPTETGHPAGEKNARRVVWANKKQAGASEYYKAAAIGKKITAVFEVFVEDYEGEMLVEYSGQLYDVERSYQTKPDLVELSCTDAKRDKTKRGPVA